MANHGLHATEPEQARFFAALRDGFERASSRTGEILRDFRIAGTQIRLRFAGDALLTAIVSGLAGRLPEVATDPPFEIRIWDSESAGVPPPPPPRPWKEFTSRGNIWGFDSDRYRSAYHWGEGSVNVMDRDARQALYWVQSSKHLPEWVFSSPLRSILHWWMELNGRQVVHAAAVGHAGQGVLMPGPGGSGKSSTSLVCLLDGMDYIADDYLALSLDPAPRLYRLYSTAKLDRASLHLYPGFRARCRILDRPEFEKLVLYLENGFADQLKDSLPLGVILRPRISGLPDTTLAPVDPSKIEHALASDTLLHLPHAGAHTVDILHRVSHEVPHASILLGTGRREIPSAIRAAADHIQLRNAAATTREREGPYISVIAHFREPDRDELRALIATLEAQDYRRLEFIVTAEAAARALAEDLAKFPGLTRFLRFDAPVVNAEAWNRGIRDAFSELLMLFESGDRLAPGALRSLAGASARESAGAWFHGSPDQASLHGALIRKSAFRACGLFNADPLYQGREHQDWLKRAGHAGLIGRPIDAVTLHTDAVKSRPAAPRFDWDLLKARVENRRRNTLE